MVPAIIFLKGGNKLQKNILVKMYEYFDHLFFVLMSWGVTFHLIISGDQIILLLNLWND